MNRCANYFINFVKNSRKNSGFFETKEDHIDIYAKKVKLTDTAIAVYAGYCFYCSWELSGKYMDLVAVYDKKTKSIRLFKNKVLNGLFTKEDLKELSYVGALEMMSYNKFLELTELAFYGNIPNTFLEPMQSRGLRSLFSDSILSRFVCENGFIDVEKIDLMSDIMEVLKPLKHMNCNKDSTNIYSAVQKRWEQEFALRLLANAANPKFPFINFYQEICKYKAYIQKRIIELEECSFEEIEAVINFAKKDEEIPSDKEINMKEVS